MSLRTPTSLGLAALSLTLFAGGCANNATSGSSEPVMRLEIQTKGDIQSAAMNPNVHYYLVFNTATMADQLVDTTSLETASASAVTAEAAEVAGNVPSTGTPAGPRSYGSFERDVPLPGYNLPFYLSGGSQPTPENDPRRTRSYTGTVPLLPVTWTDYFELTTVAGTLQLTQNQHPNPVSNPSLIYLNVRPLARGQDWLLDGNTLVLFIPIKNLVNGEAIKAAAYPVSPAEGVAPPPAASRIVMANFFTATAGGNIIDRWTLSNDEVGVRLSLNRDSQDQNQNYRTQPLVPAQVPGGVNADSVTFARYQAQMKRL